MGLTLRCNDPRRLVMAAGFCIKPDRICRESPAREMSLGFVATRHPVGVDGGTLGRWILALVLDGAPALGVIRVMPRVPIEGSEAGGVLAVLRAVYRDLVTVFVPVDLDGGGTG